MMKGVEFDSDLNVSEKNILSAGNLSLSEKITFKLGSLLIIWWMVGSGSLEGKLRSLAERICTGCRYLSVYGR